jgi:hypothetical protein
LLLVAPSASPRDNKVSLRQNFPDTIMTVHRRITILILGALIAILARPSRADDVLQHVPSDALGFVVINNLGSTDGKIADLLKTLNLEYPSPLVFLEAVTGIREGVDINGDFLLAVLPPADEQNAALQYCVWLPVTDYDRLLGLLEAMPGKLISAVRIADEDLLMAHQGDWALLMDPDQRPRMEQLLKGNDQPPAILAAWKHWITGHDAAVILLQPGIQQMLAWSARPPKPEAEPVDDDLFGNSEIEVELDPFVGLDGAQPNNPLNAPVRAAIHQWIVRIPDVRNLVAHAPAVGAAAQIDDAGNARISIRLRPADDMEARPLPQYAATSPLPPALFEKGEFILTGAGQFPLDLRKSLAVVHCRTMLDELKSSERIKIDPELATLFENDYISAHAQIESWSVIRTPATLKTGVSNNNYLAVRVASAKQFMQQVDDAMDRWNNMLRAAESETRYVFDIEETKLGDRVATQYVLDVAGAGGLPPIPEMRQIMERFFGPGGKLRLWLVPVDDQTVLLATATQEQVIAILQVLDRKQPVDWTRPELATANKLLPEKPDWKLFLSPRGYFDWKRLQNEAMIAGVPVIGGKPAKNFAASPPVAFSGHTRPDEIQFDAAAPADTLKAAGKFYKK